MKLHHDVDELGGKLNRIGFSNIIRGTSCVYILFVKKTSTNWTVSSLTSIEACYFKQEYRGRNILLGLWFLLKLSFINDISHYEAQRLIKLVPD